MKSQILKFLEQNQIYIAVGIFTAIFLLTLYLRRRQNQKKIEEAFIKADLADEKEITKNGKTQKIKFINYSSRRNKIVLKSFNKGKSSHDFLEKKQLLTEIFHRDIISIERKKWDIVFQFADWDKKIRLQKDKFILAYDGQNLIFKNQEDNSMFCFGFSGSGKTTYLRSLISQAKRIYPNVEFKIFTPKPSDFEHYCFNEHNLDEFLENLNLIENERAEAEKNKTKLQTKYIILADEAHLLNSNKEICELLNKFILMGRSQGIEVWLSSQKGTVSDYKNLHISQTKIKISVRNTESLAFAETIFTSEVARESYFNPLNHGFGYVKTPNIKGTKVKFYYE